jgi:hypothetical protein
LKDYEKGFFPGLCFTFSMTAFAQTTSGQKSVGNEVKYCAMLKDGKMMLMKDNAPVSADVTLKDGTRVTRDGSITRKDGTKSTLRNGDCIDKDGKVLMKMDSEQKDREVPQPEMKNE